MKLSIKQNEMLSFLQRNKGWHSISKKSNRTARSLFKKNLIEINELNIIFCKIKNLKK